MIARSVPYFTPVTTLKQGSLLMMETDNQWRAKTKGEKNPKTKQKASNHRKPGKKCFLSILIREIAINPEGQA